MTDNTLGAVNDCLFTIGVSNPGEADPDPDTTLDKQFYPDPADNKNWIRIRFSKKNNPDLDPTIFLHYKIKTWSLKIKRKVDSDSILLGILNRDFK